MRQVRIPSIRLRLTLGVLLILTPFLFALSHLLLAAVFRHHTGGSVAPRFPNDAESLRLLYLLSGIAVFASGVGAWLIIGRTLSPIRNLAEQARSSNPEEGSAPLVAPSADPEMVELVETLNSLLRRVAEAGEVKSRFYAAVSHELRTPLQALSGHLELASSRPRTREEYQEVVAEAQEQTRRLSALVEGVLLLHRLESGNETPLESVSVDLVAERLTEGEMVTWESREPLTIRCFSAQLEILVSNLISNAIRYGAPEEPVSLAVIADHGGSLRITNVMKDPAFGVELLNEDFSTPKRVRSSRPGNGLGIPIVQAICRANGWRLTLSKADNRLTAQVDFNSV